MSMLSKSASALPRRTHRKRVRLSTDTTTTLPEYHLTSITEYHPQPQHHSDTFFDKNQVPLDKPPDYPDSAEEADEDTDSERQRDTFFVHPSGSTASLSLRRKQRHYPHKRKFSAAPLSATSSVDPYIDSLLERSVHALEMSNTLLLQSSMSTQTSLSRMVACDSPVDTSLEARAQNLNLPARMKAPWMEDLEEITRRVDSLFGKAEVGRTAAGSSKTARLRLAHRTREDLISPPPRALTQYTETDSSVMATLGNPVYPTVEWNASTACLHSSPALPIVTDKPLSSSSTPAYTKLASFVVRRPSKSANTTPCSSFTASSTIKRRNSSVVLGSSTISLSPRLRSGTSINHESSLCHQRRPMTPPVEELSSSSSDGCVAKRTISSLRKILDEQPQAIPLPRKSHVFMPVTPPPRPVLGTSSATASISRMLTKKLHHASTRPPSPPRSAMKGSRPTTPLSLSSSSSLGPPLPASSAIRDTPLMLSQRITARVCSASSSGQSTPKKISFAELPEAHVSSRPDKFRDKGRRKGKGKGKSSVVEATTTMMKGGDGDGREGDHVGGWFTAWFGLDSPPPVGLSYAKRRDEMEDRINRNWAGRFAGGTGYDYLDEWGV